MTFREIMKLMVEGERARLIWWKKGLYIELKDNGFYNNEGKEIYLDREIKGKWELYKE